MWKKSQNSAIIYIRLSWAFSEIDVVWYNMIDFFSSSQPLNGNGDQTKMMQHLKLEINIASFDE